MATLSKLGVEESATRTAEIRTVTLNQNSTVMHQEVITLGDPDTTNALAAVLAATPASTAWGLVVRPAFSSTAADQPVLATIGGNLQSTAAAAANSSALNVRVVGGASSGADFPVRALLSSTAADNPVLVSGNSTVVIASGNSSVTVAAFAAGYVSTTFAAANSSALNVRIVSGPSSAGDMLVSVAGYSTTVSVSSLSGTVSVSPNSTAWVKNAGFSVDSSNFLNVNGTFTGSTNVTISAGNSSVTLAVIAAAYLSTAAAAANSSALNVRVVGGASSGADFPVRALLSSTAADNPVQVSGNSTVVIASGNSSVTLAVIAAGYLSTVAPSSASSGLIVRPVIDTILTTASSNAFGTSTSLTIASSGTGLRNYVTAYSITCTNAGPTKVAFYSGSSMNWPIVFAAVSSAISGANLAVSAPAYLFRTNAAETFTLQMGGSSVAGWKVAVSYFKAP